MGKDLTYAQLKEASPTKWQLLLRGGSGFIHLEGMDDFKSQWNNPRSI
jgi:hypothetical protein